MTNDEANELHKKLTIELMDLQWKMANASDGEFEGRLSYDDSRREQFLKLRIEKLEQAQNALTRLAYMK